MEQTTGKRLIELRKAKGLSVEEFAAKLGVKPSAVYGLQSDANKPSFDTLASIVHHFPDVSMDWLLTGAGPMLRDGRALSPAPAERPATTAAPVAQPPMMQVIDESGELRAVKEEVLFLRDQNRMLLRILQGRAAGNTNTGTDGTNFKSGDLTPAASDTDTPAFMYIQQVYGPEPARVAQVAGLRRYDAQDELELEESEEVTPLRIAS